MNDKDNIDKQIQKLINTQQIYDLIDEINKIKSNLTLITEKTLNFIDNEIDNIENTQNKAIKHLETINDNCYFDSEGYFCSEKIEKRLAIDEYFEEQINQIADYENALRKMLINFMFETYENLKKMVGDKFKIINLYIKPIKLFFDNNKNSITKVELINNCIKHNNTKVSKELEDKYPNIFKFDEEIILDKQLLMELLNITNINIDKFITLLKNYIINI